MPCAEQAYDEADFQEAVRLNLAIRENKSVLRLQSTLDWIERVAVKYLAGPAMDQMHRRMLEVYKDLGL